MDSLSYNKKPLSAFSIKIIALVCMVIDHVGVSLLNDLSPLRWIGRIAFPLYAFLIAEGCRHSKDRTHYLLRLGVFALISEIPFDLAFSGSIYPSNIPQPLFDYLSRTNIFYTLFFAVACIQVYESLVHQPRRTQLLATLFFGLFVLGLFLTLLFITGDNIVFILQILAFLLCCLLACGRLSQSKMEPTSPGWLPRLLALLPALPILFLAEVINCDYDWQGVALIFLLYFAKGRNMTMAALAFGLFYIYGGNLLLNLTMGNSLMYFSDIMMLCFSLLSLVFVYLYNGERGKPAKWAFYWAYPAHITIIAAIRWTLFA